MKRSEEILHELWDTIKINNLHYWTPRKSREGERSKKLIKYIMAENFPNLQRYLDICIHESNRSTQKFQPKTTFSKTLIIKLSKMKDTKGEF